MTDDEIWVKFACAAIAGYEVHEDFDGDTEDLANDIADVAEAVADVMMESLKDRFTEKPERRASRGGRGGRKGRGKRGGGEDVPPVEKD